MMRDPLGPLARLSAASLLAITPEYWKIRAARAPAASTVRHEPAEFTMTPAVVSIDGLKIRHVVSPHSSGPTVLFLSPLPQSIYCYEQSWSALDGEVNLVAVDLPGFGGSEGGMELMNFAAQSAFLEKIITHFELEDVHIVAPDVAMPVAMHYVMHREHKARSILIGDGPGVLPVRNGSLVQKIVGSGFWQTMVRLNGARTFLASATEIGYMRYGVTADELRDYVNSYDGRIDQVVAYFAGYPEGLKSIDPHIDALDLPVQVFWGDMDAFLPPENAELLHQRLPQSRLTIFEDCGHFCYQDRHEEFTQMIRDWIHGGYESVKARS